ncbi:IPT/TIG domain-containing protein [Herbihabitans rhizosphaerae]|uniref:IPT/TIG domain-containing protein n=1 Tax=Herbihabitans rhizosphaerae TaxID=1872711 RepID=A0A4Q7KJP2_9PSEU|nr:IPT/TIG domain-containing protein [Herbihabitans rhizosphaerae]RZS36407.1 IPT/TIG domain-containing protein [Herbihabitans rhizosphaerae]
MPHFIETFLVTALPEGATGTRLRLAVLVSPRLTAEAATEGEPLPASAPLSDWPDARAWPTIRPQWMVKITQGSTTAEVPAVEITGDYDTQTWDAIFPGTMPTTPYQPPVNPRGATNASYLPAVATFPVESIRNAVADLHVRVLRDFRTVFPLLTELRELTQFKPILGALVPELLTEVLNTQLAGKPVADTLNRVFAQLDLFHGARPGSALPPPTVTAVSPGAGPPAGGTLVTVTGTRFIPDATAVAFGTKAATSITVLGETTLTCRSPGGVFGEQVDVVVRTPGGTSEPSTAAKFAYLVPPTVTKVDKNRGPAAGGTTVTVTGTNFVAGNGPDGKPNTTVAFGEAQATAVSVGSGGTSLTCVTPEAGDELVVDVVVTTKGGSSPTSAASKYTYVPAPAITVVTPASGPVAGGQTVTITGTNLAGATAVEFGDVPATVGTVTATSLTCTAPAGAVGTVHITVTTDGGTSAESDADEYTFLARPTVTALNPNTGPIAGGTTVTVTGTNLASATSARFGTGAQLPVTEVAATSLKVVSPAGAAGDVHVVVRTTLAGDSTETTADLFTYTE